MSFSQAVVNTTVDGSYSTTLAVLLQATDTAAQTKTPEQLQQEAEDSGWLSTRHEFSWWYPWYRLHFIGEYNGENIIDVGVSPLPWADTGFMTDTLIKAKIDVGITDLPGLVITGMILGEMAVWLAGYAGPWVFFAVAITYIAYKLVTFGQSYNSVEKLWEFLVGNFISTVMSAVSGLQQFLPSTFRSLAAGGANIKNWVFGFIYKCIMIPLNIYLLMATWDRLVTLGAA